MEPHWVLLAAALNLLAFPVVGEIDAMVYTKDLFFAQLERAFRSSDTLAPSFHCPGGQTFPSNHPSPYAPPVCFDTDADQGPFKVWSKRHGKGHEHEGVLPMSLAITFPEFVKPPLPSDEPPSNNNVLPTLELCIAVVYLDPVPSGIWPGADNQHWCGDPSVGRLFHMGVRHPGAFRAATQLRWSQHYDTSIIPLINEWPGHDGAAGPMHIIDMIVFAKGETTETEAAASYAQNVSAAGAPLPPTIDFILGGFPKTGTSTLWDNLGSSAPVEMYGTEPRDWYEADSWRKEVEPAFPGSSLLGIKVTKFMFDKRWLIGSLEANTGIKFVISLRKPSSWLRSFVRYRQAEINSAFESQAGNDGAWARSVVDQQPGLLNVTFIDVVYAGRDLLGAHRDRGCFMLWVGPLLRLLGPGARDKLLVVFLEEMAVAPLEVHQRVARFIGMDPGQLPPTLGIVNKNTVPSSSSSSGRGEAPPCGERGAQCASGRRPEASGGTWCDPVDGVCHWISDDGAMVALDEYYADCSARLNAMLREHLGVENTWW